MMRLQRVQESIWTILAICDDRGRCQVHEFLHRLATDSASDYDQIMAQLRRTAAAGPPHNERKSRPLADEIFELKTRNGVRILYFYDRDRLVICTEAMRKPKPTELHAIVRRAVAARERYFEAVRRGVVTIIEEGS